MYSCGNSGNNFVGHWINVKETWPCREELSITKSGDIFVIDEKDCWDKGSSKLSANLENGSLKMAQQLMGVINYSKETDHIFFREYELMRANGETKDDSPEQRLQKEKEAEAKKQFEKEFEPIRKRQEQDKNFELSNFDNIRETELNDVTNKYIGKWRGNGGILFNIFVENNFIKSTCSFDGQNYASKCYYDKDKDIFVIVCKPKQEAIFLGIASFGIIQYQYKSKTSGGGGIQKQKD